MRAEELHRSGFTLVELLVVLAILGVLCTIGWVLRPRLCICREVSTRLVCASNIKGMGTAMKIYANDNYEAWPVPAFDESMVGAIDYTLPAGGGGGSVRSPNRSQESVGGLGGARQLTTTRAFWMLVRSGDVTVKQFLCPTSGDVEDTSEDLSAWYDFAGPRNVSYGYQVPFGPRNTRPRGGVDNRMILAADRGPYTDAVVALPPPGLGNLEQPAGGWAGDPKDWATFNSPNHQREGQNMLFADGHVMFGKTPLAGVDYDNIYSVAIDNESGYGRAIGESPWARSAHPFDPGGGLASTDSVIFP